MGLHTEICIPVMPSDVNKENMLFHFYDFEDNPALKPMFSKFTCQEEGWGDDFDQAFKDKGLRHEDYEAVSFYGDMEIESYTFAPKRGVSYKYKPRGEIYVSPHGEVIKSKGEYALTHEVEKEVVITNPPEIKIMADGIWGKMIWSQSRGANELFYLNNVSDHFGCIVDIPTLHKHWNTYFAETPVLRRKFRFNIIDKFRAGKTFVNYSY